jgi:iron complex transport system permease protein
MRFWLVGSIAGRPLDVFWAVAPFVVVGSILALLLGRPLNSLALGEEVAVSLGMRVGLVRAAAGTLVVVLAGAGVAMAGPIAFVGLAVPHIARVLVGPDWRWILPYSFVIGAVLLVVADTVGRIVVKPDELQVGVIVALVGAPFFVALIRRRKLVAL